MIIYVLVMGIVAVLGMTVGILITQGKTEFIHGYHQKNVKDEKAYALAMGKAITGIGVSALVAGFIAIIGIGDIFLYSSMAVFGVGFLISYIAIVKAQKKYNGGMF